jgi:hypothetical protein
MPKVKIDNVHTLDISLEEPAAIESFFIFGIHKCGSTLINKIFTDVCTQIKIPCISIPRIAVQQGIPPNIWGKCEALNSLILDGYCYEGFRSYPLFLQQNSLLAQRKKILLVRDPRDAIVSAYFSFANSHKPPAKGLALKQFNQRREHLKSIDLETYALEHAIQVKQAFNRYNRYLNKDSLLKVYRYEDIIFDKLNWITDMLKFLNLSLSSNQIEKIANKHDIVPNSEDINKHIRKVKPGDYEDKLSPESITKLNETLSDVLGRYNYL